MLRSVIICLLLGIITSVIIGMLNFGNRKRHIFTGRKSKCISNGGIVDIVGIATDTVLNISVGKINQYVAAVGKITGKLLAIDNMRKSGIGWKNLQKQVFQISEILGLEDYMFQTEKGSELFLREYENLAMYFIELGKADRAYGRGVLRINQLEQDDFAKKVQRDFQTVSEKIPREFGFSNMFMPLKKGMDCCLMKMK